MRQLYIATKQNLTLGGIDVFYAQGPEQFKGNNSKPAAYQELFQRQKEKARVKNEVHMISKKHLKPPQTQKKEVFPFYFNILRDLHSESKGRKRLILQT